MRKHIFLILLLAWAAVSSAQMRLLVANDLGRNGYYEQKPIAERMGKMAGELEVEAVLALGDIHHFMGVESVNDPLWMTNYELKIPWYPILGNHEYRGNTQAVLDYSNVSRRWQMPARYYSKVFEEDGATLRVVFIDTTPLIGKYHKDSLDYPSVPQQDAKKQLAWLEEELSDAKEDWVVVVGHHPIYAHTTKSESERKDMQKRVDPILRRHNVDMYICGHIHNFQHIKPQGTSIDYVVNSAGSLARSKVEAIEGTVFASGEAGFSILSFTKDELCLDLVNAKGKTIHSVKRTKNTQQ